MPQSLLHEDGYGSKVGCAYSSATQLHREDLVDELRHTTQHNMEIGCVDSNG